MLLKCTFQPSTVIRKSYYMHLSALSPCQHFRKLLRDDPRMVQSTLYLVVRAVDKKPAPRGTEPKLQSPSRDIQPVQVNQMLIVPSLRTKLGPVLQNLVPPILRRLHIRKILQIHPRMSIWHGRGMKWTSPVRCMTRVN